MEIKNERHISSYEAKAILEKKAKERELVYEQKCALEFLRKFCRIKEKDIEELTAELAKIEKIKPKHIIALLDHLPESGDDLKLVLPDVNLTEDEKKVILTAIKKAL